MVQVSCTMASRVYVICTLRAVYVYYGVPACQGGSVRWPGSVKTRFAFHIELGYTIVDLDIRYFAIHGYTVYLCGHRTARAVTELPCAVTEPRVRSPNCPVRSPIRWCGHRTALCGHRSACAVTDPRVLSPNCPAGEKCFY